ncbi:questin oxidase family protein [Streptomyces montanus]|uniref:Questin oxidase family protein n=1 Tax=Streptomyces montanus TaxID=2580423 RepID=A0A5R9G2I8_9ACTN|nr:questin oxidase family protein [Streptomyces montanus]TLS47054.1 questin oxidase family protein [Streptomyces montanus]
MNIDGTLDEAYERLHRTGPEFEGWLSNHGPMAVESMVRRGHARQVHRWLDRYTRRLDDRPRGTSPLTADGWRPALGDPQRLGDWLVFFEREVTEQPWRAVLETWWPRLLPGIAAGATHGVIRTGHAVHALLDHEDGPRLAELGQALGYWAARWQRVPFAPPSGTADPASALADVPRVPDQTAGINHRLDQLTSLTSWPTALAALRPATDAGQARKLLTDLTTAAGVHYLPNAHGSPVMLVHAVTAPMAVLRTLPALPSTQWVMSLHAAWAAGAAVTAAYAPAAPTPRHSLPSAPESADEVFDLAVRHQDEHVIKLADTCLDIHQHTGRPDALAAVIRATELIDEF